MARLKKTAGRPAVAAVDFPATPAGLAIGAANARQFATRRGVLPIGVELYVVTEVNLFRLLTDLLAKLISKAGAHVLAARRCHLQAPRPPSALSPPTSAVWTG